MSFFFISPEQTRTNPPYRMIKDDDVQFYTFVVSSVSVPCRGGLGLANQRSSLFTCQVPRVNQRMWRLVPCY